MAKPLKSPLEVTRDRWSRLRWASLTGRLGERVVEARWLSSFDIFLRDVGLIDGERNRLCLKDPAKGFVRRNVFWGTAADRQAAVSHARRIVHRGKTLSLTGWARALNFDRGNLRARLDRLPPERALSRERWPNRRAPKTQKSLHSSSDTVGVYRREEERRWEAKVKADGVLHYLGIFVNKKDAVAAVRDFRKQLARAKLAQTVRRVAQRGATKDRLLPKLRELISLEGHHECEPVVARRYRPQD